MSEISDMKKVIDEQKQQRIDIQKKINTAISTVNQNRKEKRELSTRPI